MLHGGRKLWIWSHSQVALVDESHSSTSLAATKLRLMTDHKLNKTTATCFSDCSQHVSGEGAADFLAATPLPGQNKSKLAANLSRDDLLLNA